MRQNGFYWLRVKDLWFVAEWDKFGWNTTQGSSFEDSDFDEIDERRIERELCKPEPDTVDDRLINDFYSQFKWKEFIR